MGMALAIATIAIENIIKLRVKDSIIYTGDTK